MRISLAGVERELRLGTGLVLALFVSLHLVNHAIGIFGVDPMEDFRRLHSRLWRNPAGTAVLYGSLITHFSLALVALYRRSTLRMPPWETARLLLGLAIVPLILGHALGVRLPPMLADFDLGYPHVVTSLWSSEYGMVKQSLLLLVVWAHLAIGLHFWLRLRPGYRRRLPLLTPLAALLPVLALLGFYRAGLDLAPVASNPVTMSFLHGSWRDAPAQHHELVRDLERGILAAAAAAVLAVLVARWLRHRRRLARGHHQLRHPSAGSIRLHSGQSVLEALRAAGVPHAAVCGGRARCTTCRVRIGAATAPLPPPDPLEAEALRRIAAPPGVRLACQLRPRGDLSVTPLLPADVDARAALRPGGIQGQERTVTILFCDLRGSTRLCETRLPYDVVFILNQFFAEMSAALAETDGYYAQFAGDGLMSLYGLESDPHTASRNALRGAASMVRRLEALNRHLASELAEPLRIGIGIHTGEAIVGTMGPPASPLLSAVGDHVNVAARLEALGKSLGCTLVISEATARTAGVDTGAWPRRRAHVRGRGEPVTVLTIDDPSALVLAQDGDPDRGQRDDPIPVAARGDGHAAGSNDRVARAAAGSQGCAP